ncbi:MAG: RNA polymerase sigma factor [Prolixibacteraceae bacterium]
MNIRPKYSDEQELLRRLVQGDEVAFELLFYRYRGKVGHFIKRSLPPHIDPEETVHEIFFRVWTHRDKLDAERPFAPYLFRIARNIVIDLLRRKIGHTLYIQDASVFTDLGVNDVELKLEEEELQSWFHSTLNKLPEQRKGIFMMSRFEGLTYPEIAKKLGISENTVDTQVRRTLQYLREAFRKMKIILTF